MIPLAVPNLAGNEAKYLEECVESTFVSTVGPFVKRFEDMVAAASGAPFAVATSAGTTALHAGLLTVGVKPGDLVICPAMTFIASANAIAHCGAIPWLMDVSRDTWTLDPQLMREEIVRNASLVEGSLIHTQTGRRVSAIVPVFTLGISADMDSIVAVAREFGLKIVVDAAAGLGTTYKGRRPGELGADLTMFSFNGNKTVTAGGGGAIAGTDEELMRAFRHLTTTARVGADYDHDIVGYNYRMTNLQAAVGCAQMEQLDGFVAAKRRIAATYNHAFRDLTMLSPFPDPAYGQSAAWFSGFYFDSEDGAAKSADVRQILRASGIDARPFWKPMHMQAPYAEAPRSALPVSEYLWDRIVTLPCSTHLSNEDQESVIEAVLTWASTRALQGSRERISA
ncbi:DegT/DnrJ/EryC1/StrS family aminotransferase [Microvirga makkahensis]|uniref:Pyridoxal-5'-phosphate-dependent protein n=1 Tax=Microvirga makkahensis TaxID=1128670 RepID=A0A7X3MTN7_9HYPH|nr:DegT/DnrJ/EryC1/StrS family aminotransferase [Microvirga makkahensis]MXQ12900.1 pyridoxal-5'-phosphate-dependent protein [Microvirga makkahensis]